jgi:type 1 glutamine amidotransferase
MAARMSRSVIAGLTLIVRTGGLPGSFRRPAGVKGEGVDLSLIHSWEETSTMSRGLNRRELLLAGGAAWLGAGAMGQVLARPQGSPKKVLFFIKSAGFPHSVVTRPDKGKKPSLAEKILMTAGKEHGFEVHATKDGREFEPDKIGRWDAFVFETTGDLTTEGQGEKSPAMSPDGEKAFLDAIRGGKGFIGMHCATDTFGVHRKKGADDPYIQMIGGHFAGHGKQQEVEIEIADPKFPGVAEGFGSSGKSFRIADEWYAQKYIADDLHVILVQVTKGMEGREYQRPNFPQTWARTHGKGRVFYTSMGHREDVWENPMYQGLLLGALGWTTGRIDADVTPNIKEVTPEYYKLGK